MSKKILVGGGREGISGSFFVDGSIGGLNLKRF